MSISLACTIGGSALSSTAHAQGTRSSFRKGAPPSARSLPATPSARKRRPPSPATCKSLSATPTIGPGIALLRLCGKTRRGRAVSAFHGSIRVQCTLSMQISRTGCILVMPSNAKRPSFVDVFTPQLSSQCYRITLNFMQFASKWLATVGPKTYQVRASTGASSQTLAKISGRNGSLFQLAPSSMKSQR